MKYLPLWIHVKRKVCYLLNTHGGTSDEQIVQKRDVETLMESEETKLKEE